LSVDPGEFRSGDPLFAFDERLVVRSWNRAAEELTGVAAEQAVGRCCWEILSGTEPEGALVCHKGCPYARLAREHWQVPSHDMIVKTASGPRRISLATIECEGDPQLFLHLMRPAHEPAPSPPESRNVNLTPRQLEVLGLLADGLAAKAIAARLGVALPTVRNHIREILRALDAHSQLEALANARTAGLLRR
jgi:DNA-binding CsgD family transcriptional regulator